jgi:ketosteroid isomerase-like protein
MRTANTGRSHGRGSGARGRSNQGRRSGGRTAAAINTKKGLCAALGNHVFDYGDKGSADQLRVSWEKLCNHVGTLYGQDISTELYTGTTVHIPKPQHATALEAAHRVAENKRKQRLARLKAALEVVANNLETKVNDGDNDAIVELAKKINEIESLDDQIQKDLPITLEGDDKAEWETQWKLYQTKFENLQKHCRQAFSMIKGQCTQALLEQMKCDTEYTKVISSNDPLKLKTLMDRAIISQSENKYP